MIQDTITSSASICLWSTPPTRSSRSFFIVGGADCGRVFSMTTSTYTAAQHKSKSLSGFHKEHNSSLQDIMRRTQCNILSYTCRPQSDARVHSAQLSRLSLLLLRRCILGRRLRGGGEIYCLSTSWDYSIGLLYGVHQRKERWRIRSIGIQAG